MPGKRFPVNDDIISSLLMSFVSVCCMKCCSHPHRSQPLSLQPDISSGLTARQRVERVWRVDGYAKVYTG